MVASGKKYFVARQKSERDPLLHLHVKINTCLQLHAGQLYYSYKGKVLPFPWQQWLCKSCKTSRYITLPILLQKENEQAFN